MSDIKVLNIDNKDDCCQSEIMERRVVSVTFIPRRSGLGHSYQAIIRE